MIEIQLAIFYPEDPHVFAVSVDPRMIDVLEDGRAKQHGPRGFAHHHRPCPPPLISFRPPSLPFPSQPAAEEGDDKRTFLRNANPLHEPLQVLKESFNLVESRLLICLVGAFIPRNGHRCDFPCLPAKPG